MIIKSNYCMHECDKICVWGDNINDDDVDMSLVCSPADTIWCDSVGFNE